MIVGSLEVSLSSLVQSPELTLMTHANQPLFHKLFINRMISGALRESSPEPQGWTAEEERYSVGLSTTDRRSAESSGPYSRDTSRH